MTEEERARARAYYAAHRERKAQIRKACYERHKEQRLAQAHAHYDAHKDQMRENARDYYQRHKEERKAYQKKRYAEVIKRREMKEALQNVREYRPPLEVRVGRWRELHPDLRIKAEPQRGRHRTVDLLAFGELLRKDREDRRARKEGGG